MDWLTFLNTMDETLNHIEVKGKENLNLLYGAILAVGSMRDSLFQLQQSSNQTSEQVEGGEADGRPCDIPTPTSE